MKKPGKFKPFEKSKKDVEKKGGPKEGSPKEEAMDKMQMFKRGGAVKRKK